MEVYYEEKIKNFQNKLDMTIICKDKMEFKGNTKILKKCSQYFRHYIETYPGKNPDFSEGEIIVEFKVVRDSILILHDLKYISLLLKVPHEDLLSIVEFLHFLLVEEAILNKIIVKLKKMGYHPSDILTQDLLSKTWNPALVDAKLAKFIRVQILSVLLKGDTFQRNNFLLPLLKDHIYDNKRLLDEYETAACLI
jgi:hypothetical protein